MKYKKIISLGLMDKDLNGTVKCTIPGFKIIAYKIPRIKLEECRKETELNGSGCYFLFNDSDNIKESVVYVGQAGTRKNQKGILERLSEHKRNPKKDYWTEAVIFITCDNSLGATEISYLEHHFCKLAMNAGNYLVKNENEPPQGNVTEEKESELKQFLEHAKMMMQVLGYQVFIPARHLAQKENISEEPVILQGEIELFLSRTIQKLNLTITASAKQTNKGFVVLKGSMISPEEDKGLPLIVQEKRRTCKTDENHILQEDVIFSSSSSGAIFVTGKSSNGRTTWKTKDGKTIQDLENQS